MSEIACQTVNRHNYRLVADDCGESVLSQDSVISEEPLNIVLHWQELHSETLLEHNFMVTMRTPGHDAYLVTGLLLSYGVISHGNQIESISSEQYNQCDITLASSFVFDLKKLTRNFISHSGCGICGANNVKKLVKTFNADLDDTSNWLPLSYVFSLSEQLKKHQPLFSATGGVHGAGLFDLQHCIAVKEDVGRHNAVDKVIGEMLTKQLVNNKLILMLSGRVSFELMQKAVAAKITVVVAIGAPSSLAVTVAKQFNITLIGFVAKNTCNIYHGDFRLIK